MQALKKPKNRLCPLFLKCFRKQYVIFSCGDKSEFAAAPLKYWQFGAPSSAPGTIFCWWGWWKSKNCRPAWLGGEKKFGFWTLQNSHLSNFERFFRIKEKEKNLAIPVFPRIWATWYFHRKDTTFSPKKGHQKIIIQKWVKGDYATSINPFLSKLCRKALDKQAHHIHVAIYL